MKKKLLNIIKLINIWFGGLCGYTLLSNEGTLELHDLKNPHKNCNIKLIKHYELWKPKQLDLLLESGYNGCRFCLKKYDKG